MDPAGGCDDPRRADRNISAEWRPGGVVEDPLSDHGDRGRAVRHQGVVEGAVLSFEGLLI